MKKIYQSIVLALLGAQTLNAQQTFSNFQSANIVIGQPSFTTNNTTTDAFTGKSSSYSDLSSKGQFAVGAQFGRVLLYNNLPSVNGASASVVLGKPDFTSTTTGCTQSLCNNINGVIFSPDGNKIIASDAGNNRVLIWNTIPTSNGANADVVIGQTTFTSSASGTAADKLSFPQEIAVTPDGRLLISDRYNNRILVFNKIPSSNGASADLVIGQANFTTSTSGSTPNKFNQPWGISFSPTGKLAVADEGNNRVLIFNSLPTANGGTANVVVGQPTFTDNTSGCAQNKFSNPLGVAFSPDGKLAVSEFINHRVMIFNTVPTVNGVNADVVLGQPSFTSNTSFNGGVTAQSMNEPYGINFDFNGRLLVNGRAMNRTMVFGTVPTQTAEVAVTIASNSSSLCLGSEITYSINVQNNGSSAASNVIAATSLPYYFTLLSSVANNGVYNNFGYWTIPALPNGSVASLVLTGTVNTSVPQTIPAYASILNSQQFDSNLSNNGVSNLVNTSSASMPTSGTISGPSAICQGNTYNFTCSGSNATSYQWWANNASVSGTGSVVPVTFATGNAILYVLPVNSSCSGVSSSYSIAVSPCTGLDEQFSNGVFVNVYPNPNNGLVNINALHEISSVVIVDLNGKVVYSNNSVNASNQQLDLSSLPNSVYLMKVKLSSGDVANSRIVIQK